MNRYNQYSQALTEIEEKLNSLLEEVRRLKPYIKELEEENLRLKRGQAISEPEAERVMANVQRIQGTAHENLERIYKEGFHVCHLHFGQPLEAGDCLFCMGFLRRT